MPNNLNEIPHLIVLATSGFFGSVFHTLRKPEKSWRAWIVRFVSGMIAAVFMGLLVTEKMGGGFPTAMAVGFGFGAFTEQLVALGMSKLGVKE